MATGKGRQCLDAGIATAFSRSRTSNRICNQPRRRRPFIDHDVKRAFTEVICGQGPAPARATIAHYKSEGLDMVPGSGLLAACVPGTFESWMMLLRDYGTMRLLECWSLPSPTRATAIRWSSAPAPRSRPSSSLFRKHWPTSAAVYLPNGEVPKPGTLFTNKTLVRPTPAFSAKPRAAAVIATPRRCKRQKRPYRKGFVAEAIDKFCRTQEVMDVSGSPHRGVLPADDMARWQPTIEAQLTYDYGRYTVCKAGVWSRGSGDAPAARASQGLALDGALIRPGRNSSTSRSNAAKPALCRPREIPRRSQIQRDPDRDAAVGCPQRRTSQSRNPRPPIARLPPSSVEGFGGVVKLRLRRRTA